MTTVAEANGTIQFDQQLARLYPAPPAPPQPACPEAALSLCLKGRVRGVDAQLTVRGATREEFLSNLLAAMDVQKHIDALTVLFDERPGTPPAAATPPANPPQSWCTTHGVQMRLNHKDGRTWYSHPLEGGHWCKGS